MKKIVFLDFASLAPIDLNPDKLQQLNADVVLRDRTHPAEIIEVLQGAQVAISNKVVLDREILARLPELRLISVAATGTNNVDLQAARELDITVCNVRDYASRSVAEHVFALILSLSRNLNAYKQSLDQGDWQNSLDFCLLDHPISEIAGKTIGIIGYGSLGKAVAQTAECFGMKVLLANRPGLAKIQPGRIMLDELLRQSDMVSLHCPLTADTENLINKQQFGQMKKTAILINTARGGIVNEADLIDALKKGEIAAAGIDVLEIEPPLDGSALLNHRSNNLIVTPHVAWASQHARQTLLDQVADIIRDWLNGESLSNIVS